MKDINANDIETGSLLETDICVIGAGAAGIALSRRFASGHKKILLVESGDQHYDERTQALYDFHSTGEALRAQEGFISRNRYYGGSTNTWHGGCAPLDSIDFETRDWIQNSGWPIGFDHLQTYYRMAAETLRLPDYELFEDGYWRQYIHDCPANFLGGDGLHPAIFLFAKAPINMRTAYSAELSSSPNIQVLLNANAIEIQTDQNQHGVSQVRLATISGKYFNVSAKIFVLCCGGWENARLLLASQGTSASGVGNFHDVVGRYYQEHPKTIAGSLTPTSKTLRSSILIWKRRIAKNGFLRVSIKLSKELQRKHRLANHYVHIRYPKSITDAISHSDSFLKNIGFSRKAIHGLIKIAPSVFRLADAFERRLLNLPLRFEELSLFSHMEQIPNPESRVQLSTEKDALGMPKLNVRLVISRDDKDGFIRFHDVLDEMLSKAGLGSLKIDLPGKNAGWPQMTDSSHHIGLTRMTADPKLGVVDRNCRVHGMSNLYIASSSVFPTGGHVNPTLTIVALAERLAAHLKNEERV